MDALALLALTIALAVVAWLALLERRLSKKVAVLESRVGDDKIDVARQCAEIDAKVFQLRRQAENVTDILAAEIDGLRGQVFRLEDEVAGLGQKAKDLGADRLRFEAALIRAATRRGHAEEDFARDLRDGWRPRA